MSWRTICAFAAGALLLAGRGGDNKPSTAPPSNDWQKADPCALLTDAEAATLLGVAQVTHAREDLAGIGPGCTWKATGADASVGVLLNQPANQDRDVQHAKRRVDVAGKPGYVQADDGNYRLIYVDGGPAWIQFSGRSAKKDVPKTYECDRSVPLPAKMVRTLGW
ncbi:DUF3558 domain-containing protein [Amycolatopsis sp. NBC_00345]|uniref:DUF3558 family protein n=1 Tax=Amycolatopsis sp. NBC_00345 TaxID=2975955 RepID=UPI002E25A499